MAFALSQEGVQVGVLAHAAVTWQKVAELWGSYYPVATLNDELRQLIAQIERAIPEFVSVLVNHRPTSLRGRSLREVMSSEQRSPARLTTLFDVWNKAPAQMYRARPSLAFAVLGQAKADGRLSPEDESDILGRLLTYWAMRSTLDASAYCAALPDSRANTSLTQAA